MDATFASRIETIQPRELYPSRQDDTAPLVGSSDVGREYSVVIGPGASPSEKSPRQGSRIHHTSFVRRLDPAVV